LRRTFSCRPANGACAGRNSQGEKITSHVTTRRTQGIHALPDQHPDTFTLGRGRGPNLDLRHRTWPARAEPVSAADSVSIGLTVARAPAAHLRQEACPGGTWFPARYDRSGRVLRPNVPGGGVRSVAVPRFSEQRPAKSQETPRRKTSSRGGRSGGRPRRAAGRPRCVFQQGYSQC